MTRAAANSFFAAPRGHLNGYTLSNNGSDATNDIDIAVGQCTSDDFLSAIILRTALTKQLDATWAAGTNAGMRESGDTLGNKTYHIFAIYNPTTGAVDIVASASATAPTMPSGYTKKRRIFSIIRAGAAITPFKHLGDRVLLSTPVVDVNGVTSPGTSAVTQALTVPDGIQVDALFSATLANTSASSLLVSSLDQTDVTPDTTNQWDMLTAAAGAYQSSQFQIRTNTSRQIRYRSSASPVSDGIWIRTSGWIDTRGRF